MSKRNSNKKMTILPDKNCCLTVEISDEDYSSSEDDLDPLFLDFLKNFEDKDYGNEDPFEDVVENAIRNNYKENQAKLFCAWKKALPEIVQAYIDFLGSNPSVALAKAGMFLLFPVNPSGAVHFELCKVLVNLRNVFAGSGEKIAEFMSIQHSDSKKCLSAENCLNIILLFNKMVKLAESEVMDMENVCVACPKVSSSNPEDKQFLMADGNFRLKGRKSLEEDSVLDFVPGSKKFDNLWLKEEYIAEFENKAGHVNHEQATPEPRRFNAIIKQGVTSTVYPVRGVFGSGCARHDTVFKMADMASGEGFKYPLACIGSLDDKESWQVPLHFMYDVVRRFEPGIKREFPS
ncbi:hypothetical protein G6F56_006570 [Rhizopus delemar]|nr:hypothetical protein G6F56_006570 [Rhizopus delemar]